MVYVTDEQIAQYKRDGYLIVRSSPVHHLRQRPDHRAPIHRLSSLASSVCRCAGLCCVGPLLRGELRPSGRRGAAGGLCHAWALLCGGRSCAGALTSGAVACRPQSGLTMPAVRCRSTTSSTARSPRRRSRASTTTSPVHTRTGWSRARGAAMVRTEASLPRRAKPTAASLSSRGGTSAARRRAGSTCAPCTRTSSMPASGSSARPIFGCARPTAASSTRWTRAGASPANKNPTRRTRGMGIIKITATTRSARGSGRRRTTTSTSPASTASTRSGRAWDRSRCCGTTPSTRTIPTSARRWPPTRTRTR